jgi:hypothetical protein
MSKEEMAARIQELTTESFKIQDELKALKGRQREMELEELKASYEIVLVDQTISWTATPKTVRKRSGDCKGTYLSLTPIAPNTCTYIPRIRAALFKGAYIDFTTNLVKVTIEPIQVTETDTKVEHGYDWHGEP